MSDVDDGLPSLHLPECPGYPFTDDSSEYICDRLLACEQRVLEVKP